MAALLFGDAEAAVCQIVREDADVASFGVDAITTDLIGYSEGLRWVRVIRSGGLPVMWMRMDNPLIQFSIFGADKGDALDLANLVRSAVFAARAVYTGHGLALFDVSDREGLAWTPNESAGGAQGAPVVALAQYTFTLSLVTRPVP